MSIAAASVLAKTYRDEYMEKIHQEFPQYNWQKTKDILQKNIAKLFVNLEQLLSPKII